MRHHTYGDWEEIDKGKLTHTNRSVDVVDYIAGNRPDVRFVAECLGDEAESRALAGRAILQEIDDNANERGTVVTLLTPEDQSRFDDATEAAWDSIHADDIEHAAKLVRAGGVRALFVAANVGQTGAVSQVAAIVKECPATPVIALVSEWSAYAQEALVTLRRCGVSCALNLWDAIAEQELRGLLVTRDSGIREHIEERLLAALNDASDETRLFFRKLVRLARKTRSVGQFARELDTSAGALVSRFFRAELPSPKQYLAAVRLLYAAALLDETSASCAQVARALNYSSPQSFGRQVRTMLGMSAEQLRTRHTVNSLIDVFCAELIAPFRAKLGVFDPTGVRPPLGLRLVPGRGAGNHARALPRTG